MKAFFAIISLFISLTAQAEEKVKMNFNNQEITSLIEHYSKASGQKFIVDSTVRGKVTILNNDDVSLQEAFNQLSEALAINGFAIIKKDDVMTVRNARSAQRDGIETTTEVPAAKPQRMVTWTTTLKNISVRELKQNIGRLMNSSYGEVEGVEKTNQIIVTDWSSSINRVAEMIKEIDKPVDPAIAKIATKYREEHKNDRRVEKIVKIMDKKDGEKELKSDLEEKIESSEKHKLKN